MLEINSISSIVLIFISLIIHSLDILAFLCSLSLSLCNICLPPPTIYLFQYKIDIVIIVTLEQLKMNFIFYSADHFTQLFKI